ncbi:MAG: Rho termination factor N-terminal domain-containing protein [Phenylobacterium sp.]|uniref:Rho termination factor N-terminal domain-containing protein n=1 Tax=Phenylobacterium sp. TaxID=1871053 RepID=UPI002722FE7C|nr:Rho termination factor N-terminal domain-containing protein [Phenylobacterium sp.]MDO8912304.1 Rho termination factor N-terminal domain-containing protein [Phenylobacterium sp.]MDP3099516.1 Rho termination factor N-terminal domain-containing protein [Phenylobacterium sp.]
MKIQITGGGIYGQNGDEIAIGTEFDVKEEPTGWAGRYTVLTEGGKGKVAVVNPEPVDPAKAELEAMTVDELKKLADDLKVDLKGASAKGDIVAALMKAGKA